MRVSANNLISPGTVAAGSGMPAMPDQENSFARRLEQAVKSSGQAVGKTAESSATAAEDAKLRAACQDMEAVFLNLMLSRLRDTVPKDGLLGNSKEEQMMTSMLDTELTKNMAKAGGMGLADMLYRQLSKPTGKSQADK